MCHPYWWQFGVVPLSADIILDALPLENQLYTICLPRRVLTYNSLSFEVPFDSYQLCNKALRHLVKCKVVNSEASNDGLTRLYSHELQFESHRHYWSSDGSNLSSLNERMHIEGRWFSTVRDPTMRVFAFAGRNKNSASSSTSMHIAPRKERIGYRKKLST
ncbi:hypothetical protein VNO77_44714 [Canavalia gladiata]|uniref:Uncharacterized protein n=1 Tax=Canavalia gladiata TaxID=3824 RepID=A0AAN9JXI4_CANGL